RIVRDGLAGQVVQKPPAARKFLRHVVFELLVAAFSVLARGRLDLFAEARRVREPELNEDREGRRKELDIAMYPVRGSAEPIDPMKYERHIARAADVLLDRRFEDGAFGDVARRAIARQAISKSCRQMRPHAFASDLRFGVHRTSLLCSRSHARLPCAHTGRFLRSGWAAASGSAPSGVEPSGPSSGKYPAHTSWAAAESASGDSESSRSSNATCGSGSVGVAA